ncbi:hypothetical protein [Nucisporomicrobium flavum]|uniref:hypothetical protein n=1 Tax=Nucisporomicrobium flavum TaxID=2785915 RepID=UPI0018F5B6F4|nr:hypothetical protein [Nucisporomicrobium flavum]
MAVDLTPAPAITPREPLPPPAPAAAGDPPTRPKSRHRRPLTLAELADRGWRPPLALAVAIFAACGPAHALGHTDLVYYAVLVGLALSACAVPLGFLASRHDAKISSRGSADR